MYLTRSRKLVKLTFGSPRLKYTLLFKRCFGLNSDRLNSTTWVGTTYLTLATIIEETTREELATRRRQLQRENFGEKKTAAREEDKEKTSSRLLLLSMSILCLQF